MITIKGAVRFSGLVKIKIITGWEGLDIQWAQADTTWENWF
jgi:hypothetical protein